MGDIRYAHGEASQWEDIIDFINYVFSQAHRPHDFKTLLPKAYGGRAPRDAAAWHCLALDGDRIRGVVAQMPLELTVLDETLRCGMIGSVSVHPYARGEGHMRRLMAMADQDAREQGYDLMILGGQRQRYNYYGFEQAGYAVHYEITQTNLRHCLGDTERGTFTFSELTEERPEEVDFCYGLAMAKMVHGARPRERFLDFMHSWQSPCRLIRRDGEMFGYGTKHEWAVLDEKLLPYVIRAFFKESGERSIELSAAPYEKERIAALSPLAEDWHISSVEMIRILNWKNTLRAMLRLAAAFKPLQGGAAVLRIAGETLKISVADDGVMVEESQEEPTRSMSEMEALRLLFGHEQFIAPDPMFHNWLPLPFWISETDGF